MQEEFSESSYKKSRKGPEKPSALEQTLLWLNRRWYSEAELRGKLARSGYASAEIDVALSDCRRYGLVDDARLAEDFARGCSARGQGVRRIRAALALHGLTGEAAVRALAAVADEASESARRALKLKLKSWRGESDWRKKREKAFRFLAGRGFPPAVIREAMREEAALNPPARPAFGSGIASARDAEFDGGDGCREDWQGDC